MCKIKDFVVFSLYLGLVSTAAALPLFQGSSTTNEAPQTTTVLSAEAFQAEIAKRQQQNFESLNTQLKDNLSKLQPPLQPEVAITTPPEDFRPKNPANNNNITKTDPVENTPLHNPNSTKTDDHTDQQPEPNLYSGFSNNPPTKKNDNHNPDNWNINY